MRSADRSPELCVSADARALWSRQPAGVRALHDCLAAMKLWLPASNQMPPRSVTVRRKRALAKCARPWE